MKIDHMDYAFLNERNARDAFTVLDIHNNYKPDLILDEDSGAMKRAFIDFAVACYRMWWHRVHILNPSFEDERKKAHEESDGIPFDDASDPSGVPF